MSKNIGLVWIKDDFRLQKNLALIEATKSHDQVVAFFLFKRKKFEDQEAQKWWVSKSLQEFKTKLSEYNISLEVIETETYKSFFENLFKRKNFSIYWNKTYEPNYLKFDNFLSKNFDINKIKFKIFKGNILNEFEDVKKKMDHLLRFLLHSGEMQKKFIWKKFLQKIKKFLNVLKRSLFLETLLLKKISIPKKNGLKNLKNIGYLEKKMP